LKAKQYIIISTAYSADTENKVCEMLKEGYQPYGGLIVTNTHRLIYSQAMVLYEQEKPKAKPKAKSKEAS